MFITVAIDATIPIEKIPVVSSCGCPHAGDDLLDVVALDVESRIAPYVPESGVRRALRQS